MKKADSKSHETEKKVQKEKATRERARTEKNRIIRLLKAADVPDATIKLLQSLIKSTSYLKAKLDDIESEFDSAPVVSEYNNGGNQSGICVSPYVKAYETLYKSYTSGMKQIMDCIPKKAAEPTEIEKPKNMLQIVMEKRKEA